MRQSIAISNRKRAALADALQAAVSDAHRQAIAESVGHGMGENGWSSFLPPWYEDATAAIEYDASPG